MLTAVLKGKAGRIELPVGEGNISWRELFQRREDLLTSVFFGRLCYLSDDGISRVLGMLIGQGAADELGPLAEVEFWPHLTGLEHRSWVEPDLLLHFDNGLVVVEVKPPFGGDQYLEQWQAEINALVAEIDSQERVAPEVVHFLALGRNARLAGCHDADDFDTHGHFELTLHTREWETVLASVRRWASEEVSRGDAAVFDDWLRAFELFGLRHQEPVTWHALANWKVPPFSTALFANWPMAPAISQHAEPEPICHTDPWASLVQYGRHNSLELAEWKWI